LPRQRSQPRAHWWQQGFLYAFAFVCLGLSSAVSAFSFGRLTVQSNLGEPLKAEVEVRDLSPSDEGSLRLRLASPQAYRLSGLEFDALVADVRAVVVRRPDGRPVIQLTTEKVVNNVFVDVILEARWPAGQRMLGYTLLVSPKVVESSTPITPAVVTAEPGAAALVPSTASDPAATGTTHLVSSGETLLGVARQYKPEGVSLDQMLVALFRANPQAFMGQNMNRMKAGAVLTLPKPGEWAGTPTAEARNIVQAHSADFGAYRSRLASALPKASIEPAPPRLAGGRVQTRVQDRKSEEAPTPDQLKLSQAAVKAASSPEAALSRRAAAQEAAQREEELSRNMQALRQLQQMSAASAASAASTAPAGLVGAAAPSASGASATPALVAASAASSAAAGPAVAASAAASAPELAASAPQKAEHEAGLLDELLASKLALPVAAALVTLLAALGAYRLWRGRRRSSDTAFLAKRFEEDSAQASTGDSRSAESLLAAADPHAQQEQDSSALAELGALGDLDPIAEAEVYLSYGRDLQAEEILRDALLQMPDRTDIRVKLLEVLALRRDALSFEPHALELRGTTGGVGPQWAHVAAMGRALDPDNPLYADGSGSPDDLAPPGDADPMPWESVETASDFEPLAEDPRALGPEPQPLEADDFSLDLETTPTNPAAASGSEDQQRVASSPIAAMEVDLGGVDVEPEPNDAAFEEIAESTEHPLERKLALAHEFMQIGDMEGARDLLDEVYASATGPMKDRARELLDEFG